MLVHGTDCRNESQTHLPNKAGNRGGTQAIPIPGVPIRGQATASYTLLTSGRLEQITLGKIYGEETLKLIPAVGALPATDTPKASNFLRLCSHEVWPIKRCGPIERYMCWWSSNTVSTILVGTRSE